MQESWNEEQVLENGNTLCKHEEFYVHPSRQFLEAAAYMLKLLGKRKKSSKPTMGSQNTKTNKQAALSLSPSVSLLFFKATSTVKISLPFPLPMHII